MGTKELSSYSQQMLKQIMPTNAIGVEQQKEIQQSRMQHTLSVL